MRKRETRIMGVRSAKQFRIGLDTQRRLAVFVVSRSTRVVSD